MKVIIYLAVLVSLVMFVNSYESIERTVLNNFENEDTKTVFKVFHYVFKKDYEINSAEAVRRYRLFKSKLAYIKEENQKGHSYTLGITKFMDYTQEELEKYKTNGELMEAQWKKIGEEAKIEEDNNKYANFFDTADDDDDIEIDNLLHKNNYRDFDNEVDSDEMKLRVRKLANVGQTVRKPIDWRSKMSAIRDQQQCGSCWAFAAAAAMEGTYRIKNSTSNFTHFSTQELVDCDVNSRGCNGGWGLGSILYFAKQTGMVLESVYPYTSGISGAAQVCNNTLISNINTQKFKTTSTGYCQSCTIDQFYGYLAKGPILISSYVTNDWFLYTSGIFTIKSCPSTSSNHAVVAVGWGMETINGELVEYTIVRNSWGIGWGDKGHIKIRYQPTLNASCFINLRASLPIW